MPDQADRPTASDTTTLTAAAQPAPPKIQTGFTPWLLLADFVSRYVVYLVWREGHLPTGWFWACQLLVVPFGILYWSSHRDDVLKASLGVASNRDYEVKDAPPWIVFMLALMVHNIAHAFTDVRIDGRPVLRFWVQMALACAAGMYTLGLGVSSSTDERLDVAQQKYERFDEIDENDRILTRLKTELDDFIRKVEAYTIESTLIGAISFAAFVTIVMADKGRFETAHNLLTHVLQSARSAASLSNWHRLWLTIHYPQEPTILVGVAFTAVLCSLFFMGVMVARLRFSALLGDVSYSTEMAANLNGKENDLAEVLQKEGATDVRKKRLLWLHEHVDRYLNEARVGLDQLRPIIVYMTIFRTLGLMAFMLTLVLSALWFGPRTALCFAIIAVITYCYPWIDAVRDKRLRRTDFRALASLIGARLSQR